MDVYDVKYTITILYCSVETFKERAVMGPWKSDINFKIRKLTFI